jgi:hypothetical protein
MTEGAIGEMLEQGREWSLPGLDKDPQIWWIDKKDLSLKSMQFGTQSAAPRHRMSANKSLQRKLVHTFPLTPEHFSVSFNCHRTDTQERIGL